MLPMTVLTNYFLFGTRYFLQLDLFIGATFVTFIVLSIAFFFYGLIAISLRKRLPYERQTVTRLSICIPLFILLTGVYLSIVFRAYEQFNFFNYEFTEESFIKSYVWMAIINVFLTFLNEGVSKFEQYKMTLTETEQLKKEYMQSQLLGLKSQMNPHFLFNSMNTLSSLIHEDSSRAEHFLDHMSKVYRYLLRNHEERLVTLRTELSFIHSYYFLLKARYADGLQLRIDVPEDCQDMLIPPLTLQMIFESALNQNIISKNEPLQLEIFFDNGLLKIRNNIRPKISREEDLKEGLTNIANKFRLLCQQEIIIEESLLSRSIQLPLLLNSETLAV